jgi:hypothetical protein
MNVHEWIGARFLKPEEIGTTPIVLTIVNVSEGKWGKLDLSFNDGSKLSLNTTNGRAIARAWGYESDDWIDKMVELSVGLTSYKGEQKESILVKPITPATPANALKPAKPRKPIDADVSF